MPHISGGSWSCREPVAGSKQRLQFSFRTTRAWSLADLLLASALCASATNEGPCSARGSLGGDALSSFRTAFRRVNVASWFVLSSNHRTLFSKQVARSLP